MRLLPQSMKSVMSRVMKIYVCDLFVTEFQCVFILATPGQGCNIQYLKRSKRRYILRILLEANSLQMEFEIRDTKTERYFQ